MTLKTNKMITKILSFSSNLQEYEEILSGSKSKIINVLVNYLYDIMLLLSSSQNTLYFKDDITMVNKSYSNIYKNLKNLLYNDLEFNNNNNNNAEYKKKSVWILQKMIMFLYEFKEYEKLITQNTLYFKKIKNMIIDFNVILDDVFKSIYVKQNFDYHVWKLEEIKIKTDEIYKSLYCSPNNFTRKELSELNICSITDNEKTYKNIKLKKSMYLDYCEEHKLYFYDKTKKPYIFFDERILLRKKTKIYCSDNGHFYKYDSKNKFYYLYVKDNMFYCWKNVS